MKKKRERLEIIHDILVTAANKERIGPTRLLQLSNLSPKMFRDYLSELLEQELLEEERVKKRKYYRLTDKGYHYLERYKQFTTFIEELGL